MFTSIILAGASGSVGSPILRNLLASSSPKFHVTVLTRKDPQPEPKDDLKPEAETYQKIPVDYDDHVSLVRALSGADVVISALPSPVAQRVDQLLLRAAQEAGVRRILPSEYTLDLLHPAAVAGFGEDSPAVQSARRFESLADDANSVTSFTTIVTGMFTDLFLDGLLNIWNWNDLEVMNIDGGDKLLTTSSTEFVAACVVAVLKMDEEKTKNRRIRIAENQTTIQEITRVLEEISGQKFKVIDKSSQELSQAKDEATRTGNILMAYVFAVLRVNFDGSGAGNLEEGLEFGTDGATYIPRKSLKELAQAIVDRK